jgi:hypothetical protein
MTPLTEKQLEAVRIMLYRRSMPLTEKASNHKAINRTTAWGLQEANLAICEWERGEERVKLPPAAKQLVKLGRQMGRTI